MQENVHSGEAPGKRSTTRSPELRWCRGWTEGFRPPPVQDEPGHCRRAVKGRCSWHMWLAKHCLAMRWYQKQPGPPTATTARLHDHSSMHATCLSGGQQRNHNTARHRSTHKGGDRGAYAQASLTKTAEGLPSVSRRPWPSLPRDLHTEIGLLGDPQLGYSLHSCITMLGCPLYNKTVAVPACRNRTKTARNASNVHVDMRFLCSRGREVCAREGRCVKQKHSRRFRLRDGGQPPIPCDRVMAPGRKEARHTDTSACQSANISTGTGVGGG